MLPRSAKRIQDLALRPIRTVTIQELLARSARVSEHDHVQHAEWLRQELPVRLAHRLEDFNRLPYMVVCNSNFFEIYRILTGAFEALDEFPSVTTMDHVHTFATKLEAQVSATSNMIHMLSEGYAELRALLDSIDLDIFLDQTLTTRIGNRVLAEHFLAVHDARVKSLQSDDAGVAAAASKGGIVNPTCRPADIIRTLAGSLGSLCGDIYGVSPGIALQGQVDTEFCFVPDHLRFVLQEVLKNAMRATAEEHSHRARVPQVVVEIMKGSFDVTIKISDVGGGMKPQTVQRIWQYGYTTTGDDEDATPPPLPRGGGGGGGILPVPGRGGLVGEQMDVRRMAGYGFGLPLSRVYCRYFGGDVHLQSMHGYGTDVYLNFNHLGDVQEHEKSALPFSKLRGAWRLA